MFYTTDENATQLFLVTQAANIFLANTNEVIDHSLVLKPTWTWIWEIMKGKPRRVMGPLMSNKQKGWKRRSWHFLHKYKPINVFGDVRINRLESLGEFFI